MTPEISRASGAIILDGYVDEPACLGVPPYISPYIRTVAGALGAHDFAVRYLTIDQLRNNPQRMREMNRAGLLVVIAGVTVRENTLAALRHPHRDPAGGPHDPGPEKTDRRSHRLRVRRGGWEESGQAGHYRF